MLLVLSATVEILRDQLGSRHFRRKWKLSVGLGFEGQRHLARLCSKMQYVQRNKDHLYRTDTMDVAGKVRLHHKM